MKVYVETNPETIYSGRVKDEVKTTEIRMWFETDEEIEVLSLTDYTKQVRKGVVEEIREEVKKLIDKDFGLCNHEYANGYCYGLQYDLAKILDRIQGGQRKCLARSCQKSIKGISVKNKND